MAKVLLVDANPAVTASPVAPYGMERVAHAFKWAGCQVRMEAPFIEADPLSALRVALAWGPDLVGFSVPGIDDGLTVRSPEGPGDVDTTFHLDAIKPLVVEAIAHMGGDRVLIGGTALSSGPDGVLAYLGGRIGITGPADDLCWKIGRELAKGRLEIPEDPRVILLGDPHPLPRGFADPWRPAPGPTPRMPTWQGLALARGGRVAVQISAGCDRRCAFCAEAHFLGFRVTPRPVDEIATEIEALRRSGVRRFWLGASELNVPDTRHALRVLAKLAPMKLDLRATLQAAPVTDALLDGMIAAGVDPATTSFRLGHLDDDVLRAGGGPTNRASIDRLVSTWLRRGIRRLTASVWLGAHPSETEETLSRALAAIVEIDHALPEGLHLQVSAGARVYPQTALARYVTAHREAAEPYLFGAVEDPTFVRPVVFSRPRPPRSLLTRVTSALAGLRGSVHVLNGDGPSDVDHRRAEALVNRGLWRQFEDRDDLAEACLVDALEAAPLHVDALWQLGMSRANRTFNPTGAIDVLRKLAAALPPGDPRRPEVESTLTTLGTC